MSWRWKRKPIRGNDGRRIGWEWTGPDADKHATYNREQPWIITTFLSTDRETRITGRSRVRLTCAICGTREVKRIRIPRFGPVSEPEGGNHRKRVEFQLAHLHRDRQHPMSWALPLLNPDAHKGGIDLNLLAMRLEADLNRTGAADV